MPLKVCRGSQGACVRHHTGQDPEETPRKPKPQQPGSCQRRGSTKVTTQGQLPSSRPSALVPQELQGEKAHTGRKTQYDSELSHTSTSDLIKATALSHSHFPGAVHRIRAQFAATLSGEDKTTETKVGTIADALNNATMPLFCKKLFKRPSTQQTAWSLINSPGTGDSPE